MSRCLQVINNPSDVHARLAQIGGLTVDVLHEAVIQGEQGRANATENHPVTAPGMLAYFERVRALRDQLLRLGWEKRCVGSELTVSPDGKHAIVVASGDENTGSSTEDPKTKCAKGVRMEEAASRNAIQLDFFVADPDEGPRLTLAHEADGEAMLTWVLLVGRSTDEITVELSLPIGLGIDGRAAAWSERIILPSLPLDEDGPKITRPGPEPGPEFEVEVSRKIA